MTNLQYRNVLRRLGLSQMAAARLIGVDARTSRRWALDERAVPAAVVIVLRLLVAGKITIKDVEEARA